MGEGAADVLGVSRTALEPVPRARPQPLPRTPHAVYAGMRRLRAWVPPVSDRVAQALARPFDEPLTGPLPGGLLGDLDADRALAVLRHEGMVVFPEPLPADLLDDLRSVGHRLDAHPRPATGRPPHPFDPEEPGIRRADIHEADLLTQRPIQRLVADPSLRAFAGRYLDCDPVNDLVTMWWSAAVAGTAAESVAAQQFHADLDRLRFVKFFAYLTDVGPDQGPHVYVRGSHRRRPPSLRADRRFTDGEVAARFPAEDLVSIEGPAGTIFAADTSGLHKGLPLVTGNRLVVQLEFASGLLGAPYTSVPADTFPPDVRRALAAHPWTYRRFLAS